MYYSIQTLARRGADVHSYLFKPQSHYLFQFPPLSSPRPWVVAPRSSERVIGLPYSSGRVIGPPPVAVDSKVEERGLLPAGLTQDLMPRHVAMIMDGNMRWARQRGLPGKAGHEACFKKLWAMADICRKWEIKVFSGFAFSTQNWNRPREEVDFLMEVFERSLLNEVDNLISKGIRVSVIGDRSKLPHSLAKAIAHVEEMTKSIPIKLNVVIAFGYSGRDDMLQACTRIAHKVKEDIINLDEINESLLEREFMMTDLVEFPNPDLMIRTSGELRVSNFFLWQLAYTELYFSTSLWPDFDEDAFAAALSSYQKRDRRFGARV